VFTIDDVDTKVVTSFGNGLVFAINDLTEPRMWGGSVKHSGTLLESTYRIVGDEIHYLISSYTQEQLGFSDIIIFRRTEDYEPICPEWIASFVPQPD